METSWTLMLLLLNDLSTNLITQNLKLFIYPLLWRHTLNPMKKLRFAFYTFNHDPLQIKTFSGHSIPFLRGVVTLATTELVPRFHQVFSKIGFSVFNLAASAA
ncbi:hypothetical protein F5050DRAFT_683317 [Lentinula boryana]|uniref:Uncharacterized protein n=1 Tax=Lentinula boryana TaxID=40481 RepID=A0ABQ8Q573_9AGAR|nr:hypothetical protein F5050DRAFT_683317 [Lentinula boryana]